MGAHKMRHTDRERSTVPVTLGHEKLLALGLGCADLGRSVQSTKQNGQRWLDGEKPTPRFAEALRKVHGIAPADWERKPTGGGGEGGLPPEPPDAPRAPVEIPTGVDLEDTLRHVRAARVVAEGTASSTAVASLLAQESRLVQAITAERQRRQTERERVLSCGMVQGAVRVCTDILQEELGDEWSRVADRIMAAWGALDDEGKLPEGFEA